jgi:hypothetical protein
VSPNGGPAAGWGVCSRIKFKKFGIPNMSTFAERLKTWQGGYSGFTTWLSDIEPRILTRSNKYEVFKPTPKQRKIIKSILQTDKQGRFTNTISLNIEPRRHGKSTIFALIVLWLFTSRQNHTTTLLNSTEDSCRRVQFFVLKRIINNTPKLSVLIPEQNQFQYTIVFPELSNQIQFSASNLATSFGDRISVLWASDLHAFVDMGPFNALQASLLDSEDSLCFLDSNIDENNGPVHALEKEAKTDDSIFANYTHYKDFEDFEKHAPVWIDRQKAKRLEKTTLPADFKRDILGQRSDAKNALFSAEIIKQCRSKYQIPVESISNLVKNRAYKVGAGLDRAKSLIAGPRGDHTVWTVVLKVAHQGGEPEYYLLNQHRFLINSDKHIKKVILQDHKKYRLDNVIFENYEVGSLHAFMIEQKIPVELISAHDTNQAASFPEMYRCFAEGRFHFPESLKEFQSELSTFAYTRRKNGTYSFGHAAEKFHDDTVYSTNWALFSLRREVLNLYEINNIQCFNKSNRRHMCFLMGGGLELFCGRNCAAFQEVEELYRQFKAFQMDSELTLPEFFHAYVKVTGAVIYQAV